jgi:hypothetical protein
MTEKANYGPDNPHPLSTLKTELVWEKNTTNSAINAHI